MPVGLRSASIPVTNNAFFQLVSPCLTISAPQTHHVYSTLKRRGNDRFYVVSSWNTRLVFVGHSLHCTRNGETRDLVTLAEEILYGKLHFLPLTIFARHRFFDGFLKTPLS